MTARRSGGTAKPSRHAANGEAAATVAAGAAPDYRLDAQIGYLLRRSHQRASAIFGAHFGKHRLTPRQWATLAKIHECGSVSQNHLGRMTAMDPATVQGVVHRLVARGLVGGVADPRDGRRTSLSLTEAGRKLVKRLFAEARAVSRETLEPLSAAERAQLIKLLERVG